MLKMSCQSSIRHQDLNSRPSEHEPPPITTRPGLSPYSFFFWQSSHLQSWNGRNIFNFKKVFSYSFLFSSLLFSWLWISGIGSKPSTDWATTTAQQVTLYYSMFVLFSELLKLGSLNCLVFHLLDLSIDSYFGLSVINRQYFLTNQ